MQGSEYRSSPKRCENASRPRCSCSASEPMAAVPGGSAGRRDGSGTRKSGTQTVAAAAAAPDAGGIGGRTGLGAAGRSRNTSASGSHSPGFRLVVCSSEGLRVCPEIVILD
jgi:hypothetical protein